MNEQVLLSALKSMTVKVANLEVENAILKAQLEAYEAVETPGLHNMPTEPRADAGEPVVDPSNPTPIS